MKIQYILLTVLLCCSTTLGDDAVAELSSHLNPKTPALVVVVCAGDEADTATVKQLVEQTAWTLFCRGKTSAGMDRLRNWAQEQGLLGKRVYVIDDNGPSLWLASDMADAVWGVPDVQTPTADEIMRVLCPGGVSIAAGKVVTKPAPQGVDEWRHPYHGPDNNVVSQDTLARLPGEMRFQTHPVFAPMPNQTLFAGGRIFFFSGHIAFHEREEALLNTLTVLNAYNGLTLWSRPLDPEQVVHNIVKLATDHEVVFAEGPILRLLDAATGQERAQFRAPAEAVAAGDTDWKWIVQQGDTLWAAFGPPDARVTPYKLKLQLGHWPWNVANDQYRGVTNNFGAARRLVAYAYPEMTRRWNVSESQAFDARALCIEDDRLFTLAPGKYMAARAAKTGRQIWRQTPDTAKTLFATMGLALKRQGWGLGWSTYCYARASEGVVCIAGPSFKKTLGIGLEKGDLLWSSDLPSPHPFFLDDALYVVPRVANPNAFCRRVEPLTGKTIDEFPLGVTGSCTRLTVTPNQFYYRPGGGEGRTVYVDLAERQLSTYEGVVRPGCFDGVVPANGRLYWMPLACDCWQVHGTFCMAPRRPLDANKAPAENRPWATPLSTPSAKEDDWPMYRANAAGTATVPVVISPRVSTRWQRSVPGGDLTAPICVQGHVFVGSEDGTVAALDAANGKALWNVSSHGAVLYPPAYWQGRIVFGSCDGAMYSVDAATGRSLGRLEMAPEKRFVNIMGRFMSAWPLGGGVVVGDNGTAYAAAGSTAADGAVAAAVDLITGKCRWHQVYTLDRKEPALSFGVQGNLLLKNDTLYINGGAPTGIVTLDARDGGHARVAAKLEAGMETFLEPDGRPLGAGPELFSHAQARTTIFKRHQGRVYFRIGARHIALIDGRLFCSRDRQALDRLVDRVNEGPRTTQTALDIMKVSLEDAMLWAGMRNDVCGLAVGTNGLVVLYRDSTEAVSADGRSLWTVPLPVPPVRWGIALCARECVVTLTNGQVVCLTNDE